MLALRAARAQRELGAGVPSIEELSPAAKKLIECARGMAAENALE